MKIYELSIPTAHSYNVVKTNYFFNPIPRGFVYNVYVTNIETVQINNLTSSIIMITIIIIQDGVIVCQTKLQSIITYFICKQKYL